MGIMRFHLEPLFVSGMLIVHLYRLLVSRQVVNVIFRFACVISLDQLVARLCVAFSYYRVPRSIDFRRRVSATSIRDVGYFLPKLN